MTFPFSGEVSASHSTPIIMSMNVDYELCSIPNPDFKLTSGVHAISLASQSQKIPFACSNLYTGMFEYWKNVKFIST